VQAENYDTGGQGVAYNVTSVNGTANNYRPDGVDLEVTTDTGGGHNLGWTAAGQWFKYTVNVTSAGTYAVTFRVAAINAVTDAFHISNSSGANLTGDISVPATGAWQSWTNVTATFTLPAGQQILTFDQDHPGWNINYFSVPPTKVPSVEHLGLFPAQCKRRTTIWAAKEWATTCLPSTARLTATVRMVSIWR
jgi:hypothetical protein